MTVSDVTKQSDKLSEFLENLGDKGLDISNKWQKSFEKDFISIGYYSKCCYCSCELKSKKCIINITLSDKLLPYW